MANGLGSAPLSDPFHPPRNGLVSPVVDKPQSGWSYDPDLDKETYIPTKTEKEEIASNPRSLMTREDIEAREDILAPHKPTWREEGRATIQDFLTSVGMDKHAARNFAESTLGNPASERKLGLGLADVTGLDIAYMAQEGVQQAQRGVATGDIGEAAMGSGIAALSMLPFGVVLGRALKSKAGQNYIKKTAEDFTKRWKEGKSPVPIGLTTEDVSIGQPTKLSPARLKHDTFTGLAKKVRYADSPDLLREVVQPNMNDVRELTWDLISGDRGATDAQIRNMQKQIYTVTQQALSEFPDTMTVYRIGDTRRGEVVSFTVDPNFTATNTLPWVTDPNAPLVAYTVAKADILAAPNANLSAGKGTDYEQEVLINSDDVTAKDVGTPLKTGKTAEDSLVAEITTTKKPRPDIDELGFYSVAGRAIDELPLFKHQQVAPGDQVLKAIIKRGATKEEIHESGLAKFLEGKKKVTQQEVQDYFKANQVKLSEVVLRDKGDLTKLEWEDSGFISSEEYKAKKIESMVDSFNYGGEVENVYNRLYSPAHGDFQSIYRYMSAIDNSKYSPENQHIYMGALQSEGIEGLDGTTKKDFLQALGDYIQKDITDAEMIGEKFKLFKTKDGMYEIFGEDQITGWSSISYGEAKGLADLADTIEEAKIQTQAYETDITLETGGEARWRDYASPGGENYEELLLTVPRRQLSDEARPRNYTDPHYRDIEDNIVAHLRTTKRDNVKVRGEIIETVHAEEIQSKVHSEGRKQGYVQEPPPITEEIQAKIDRYKELKHSWAEDLSEDKFLQLKDEYALLKNELAPWLDRQSNRIADLPFKETWHEMLFNRLVYKAIKEGKDAVSWTVGKTQVDRYGDERLIPFYDTKLTGYAQKFSNKHGGAKVTHGTFKRPPDYEEVWVLPITKEMRSSILKEGNKQFKTGGLITKQKNFQSGGLNMARTKEATYDDTEDQMNMMGFDPREESIDPVSGNEVPLGGTPEGVRDNIDVKMSPGEMVIPEYAVNYHGVETYINSIQKAQQGYEQMQDMGLMGNPDEAIMDESEPLPKMKSEEVPEYQTGGLASFGDLSSVAIPQVPTSAVAVPQSATAEPIAQPLRPTSTVAVPQVVPVNNVALTAPLSEPLRPTSLQVTSDYSAPVGAAPIGASEEVSLYSNLASPVSTPPNIIDYVIKNNTPSIGDSSLSLQPQVAPSIGGGQGSAASASAPSGTASAAPAPSAQASAQAAAQAGLASTTAPGLAAISGLAADTTAAITKSTHAAHTQTPMQALFSTFSLNDPSVDVVGKTISATDVASEVAKMAINSIFPTVIPLPLSNVLNPISMVTGIANSIANHASQPQMAVDQAARGVPNTGVHSATGYSFHAVPSLLGNLLGLDAIAVYNEKDPTAPPESVDVALANMAFNDNIDTSFMTKPQIRSLYGLVDENGLRSNNIAELTATNGVQGIAVNDGHYRRDGTFMSKDGVTATSTTSQFSQLTDVEQSIVAIDRSQNDPTGLMSVDTSLMSDAAISFMNATKAQMNLSNTADAVVAIQALATLPTTETSVKAKAKHFMNIIATQEEARALRQSVRSKDGLMAQNMDAFGKPAAPTRSEGYKGNLEADVSKEALAEAARMKTATRRMSAEETAAKKAAEEAAKRAEIEAVIAAHKAKQAAEAAAAEAAQAATIANDVKANQAKRSMQADIANAEAAQAQAEAVAAHQSHIANMNAFSGTVSSTAGPSATPQGKSGIANPQGMATQGGLGGVTGQGPAPTPSSQMGGMGIGFGGGGGPSGGPGKIICLESHRQGLLDTKIFEADEAWGDIIPKIVLDGYHLWAKPVVRKMRKSRSFSKKVAWLAKPVAKEAAKQMGVGEGSKIGLAMLCVGMPICAILGAAMLPFKQKNTNLILGDK